MRLRGSLFWGIVLIVLAALLLLNQQGWLKGDIFSYFWPVVIILFGSWLLIGALNRGQPGAAAQKLSIPLESAHAARIKLDHAAGRLNSSDKAEIASRKVSWWRVSLVQYFLARRGS